MLSNPDDRDIQRWQELLTLASMDFSQISLESLITEITSRLEENISCSMRIWLNSSVENLVLSEGEYRNNALISHLLPIMEKAYKDQRVTSNVGHDPIDFERFTVIAIPLMKNNEILGVVQLEKKSDTSFTLPEVEFCIGITFQISIILNNLILSSNNKNPQQSSDRLTIIEEINKSILSNLDTDSLLNSVISLIHQKLNFIAVRMFLFQDEDKKIIKQIGISHDGIDNERIFVPDHDQGPISWSLTHGALLIINNTHIDHRFSPSLFADNIHSEVVIPINYGESFLGLLELSSETENVFDPESINDYRYLAINIATALRNANLFHTVQIRSFISDRLNQIGRISEIGSLDDLLQKLMGQMEEFLPWDATALWLVDSDQDEIDKDKFTSSFRLVKVRINNQAFREIERTDQQDPTHIFDQYIQYPDDANALFTIYPWISEIAQSKTSIIRNSGSAYRPLGAIIGFKEDYSAICVPLTETNHTVGFVVMVYHRPDQYNAESKTILNIFSEYASTIIENIRLYAAAHNQAWISTVMLQVTEATQSITSINDLLETVVDILPELIGVDTCMVFLWDQTLETFFPQASKGFDEAQLLRLNAWVIDSSSIKEFDELNQNNSPLILDPDTLSDEILLQVFPYYDFENNLLILFPLATQNRNIGVILIDFTNSTLNKHSPQEIWDEKYTLIQGVAHQTAIALENLQLIRLQEEEAYISVALLQVAQAIVSLNQLDEILSTIVRIMPILVNVKRCIIYLWNDKEKAFCQSQSFGFSKNELALLGKTIKSNEFPFIERIQKSNQIVYSSLILANSPGDWNGIVLNDFPYNERIDDSSEEGIINELDEKLIKSKERLLIGFPLSVKNEVLGVMLIEEEDPKKNTPGLHIREKRMEIVKGINQQAAIAIKNELLQQETIKSKTMERELQLAREIQTAFLPERLLELIGWDIDVSWQPAHQVGGDFYDIIMLDDNRVGFVIADVADKGMPAALFMTLIRTLIRSAAKEKSSPAAVLKQVNELLIPDSKHGMFVTVFYGVYCLNSGSVVYANAGHNPPIVKQVNPDELIELYPTSMALGIFDNIQIEEKELVLNPGDWMLLYTDGITEAFSANEEIFGKERLMSLLNNYQFTSCRDILHLIEGAVLEFIKDTELSDDMTLAAIYRKLLES